MHEKKLDISLLDLENMTGINASSLSKYEREAAAPSVDMAQKIANALNISVDELINGSNDEKIKITLSYDQCH